MSWIEVKAKREQHTKLVRQGGDLLKRAHAEKRELSPEENEEFTRIHEQADALLKSIENFNKQAEAEETLDDGGEEGERFARAGFEVRDGKPSDEQKSLQERAFHKRMRGMTLTAVEERALTVGGSGTGAEAVPQSFWNGYYEKLRETGSIRRANPFVVTSSHGRETPYPVYDDTANEGEIITAGGTDTASADPSTAKLMLKAYIFSSKVFSLAKDWMQDITHNADALVSKMGADRISVHLDRKLTVGTGTNEPGGAVSGATVGKTSTATNAVTYNEFLDLIHSLKEPYRDGAVLMMNDATLLAVKKLVDGDGNSIWFHGAAGNAGNSIPPTIAGVPYIVNPYMANLGAGNKPVLYGNFQRGYVLLDVTGAELMVDPYSLMKKYLINYCMFSRHGGGVVDSSALKVLQNAAS